MADEATIGKVMLLAANLKHRGADILDHFCQTGEIRAAGWFPVLEGGDLRIAFEIAQGSIEKVRQRRVAQRKASDDFGQNKPEGHDLAS